MPPGPVEQKHGMGAASDGAGDLVEMELHRLGIGKGQRQGGTGAASGADRAEEVDALVSLVGGLAGPRSSLGPLPNETVLLADAGFVLEPDLDRLSGREAGEVGLQRGREVFLKASIML